ncbi:YceI family protein [Mangrovimonas spongiae]|uniref:YceI family protein n=1 Tax=Mangrovimonas spongiae TaxID=2494697 RepID=A0A3R9USB8_9FLAO|nr:YceI family protein [Mangrovimonas spongiae]RSK39116.1 YceI family protein [Mangrovimonas spongiae]
MVQFKTLRLLVVFLILGLFNQVDLVAQNYSVNNQKSSLLVLGTSSLHDWEITAEQQKGTIQIENTEQFALKDLTMTFDVNALKSGKSSMDKNTRKALDYSDYKTINFKLTKVKSITKKRTGYSVVAVGNLTIAGTTKSIELPFTLSPLNGTVSLSGEKDLKMTTFNVEPPTALLGTITTGDEITIQFNTVFN